MLPRAFRTVSALPRTLGNNVGQCQRQQLHVKIDSPHRLTVVLESGLERTLTTDWIVDNSNEARDPMTNQKVHNVGFDLSSPLTIQQVTCDATLLNLCCGNDQQFTIDLNWLTHTLASSSSTQFDPLPTALSAHSTIPRVNYNEVINSDEGLYQWTSALADTGLCIVENAPLKENTVTKAAGRIAPPIETLYGSIFDVRTETNPINIAYTNAGLRHHQDLAYYESPPGLQFLHCLAFDDTIVGGQSTFLDTFVLVNLLREENPAAYETFTKIPATFQKDHVDRENPAQFFYRRPHVTTNATGDVTQVFWSPAFEGPLHMDPATADALGYASEGDAVDAYYEAYRAFTQLLLNRDILEKWEINLRAKEGELLSFNQRRMLHGREAFHGKGERHFQGCYVGEGDFASRHRVLDLKYGVGVRGKENVQRLSNGCHR
jgi:gamma-butyrobetaine dioxygenase|tara:strand:- start:88 stop:1386 length:1299 start_codon:yes stop_codon:yes gene_type:complete